MRISPVFAVLTLAAAATAAEPSDSTLSAALGPDGSEVRLVTQIGGKAKATLQIGKATPVTLATGDAVGTVESAHGIVVVALAITDKKEPFRIVAGDKTTKLARPRKSYDIPFAIAMTPTPEGFTVFFQEIEAQNTNEAHTYMQTLGKDGAPKGELREVAVPWWLGDAVWNGNGYHLALYYAASSDGIRLSMVSTDVDGRPQQHPDWASAPGMVSDVHLVADGARIRAYYRGGAGDRVYVTDVTTIGQWGGTTQPAKDLGALARGATFTVGAKGKLVKIQ